MKMEPWQPSPTQAAYYVMEVESVGFVLAQVANFIQTLEWCHAAVVLDKAGAKHAMEKDIA